MALQGKPLRPGWRLRSSLGVGVLGAVLSTGTLFAQGIPEPGLVLYGVARNLDGQVPARMTAGVLTCRITPPTGAPISLTSTLRDINGQFSYVLTVPFETETGAGLSSNTLAIPASTTSYVMEFRLTNVAARPATNFTFVFSRADRARQQRVDADFFVAFPDADGDGLPDWWENLYFGGRADPKADADGDGLNNLAEYLAGTDPTDPSSALAFVRVSKSEGGMGVEWSSATNRLYTLLRSTNLLGGFAVLQEHIAATPPRNGFLDATAIGGGPFFYRVRLE